MNRQKEKAVECLQELDVCYEFIKKFIDNEEVTVFDSFIGENIKNYSEVQQKIKEIESQYKCLVFAVTHEYFDFGECYSLLVVSKYEEEWEQCLRYFNEDSYSALAYVWNKTDDNCSEFGSVVVNTAWGGLLRVY